MNEELKVPDVIPEPPPDIAPEYKNIVGYIAWGNDLRKFRDTIVQSATALLWIPIIGWMLYGAVLAIMFTVYELLILLADLIDALWNNIADIINYLYNWWLNFKKAIDERYQGNWWKAILEVTIRVLLLSLLSLALNIPAVKQLWDIFVSVIQRINQFLIALRNGITDVFNRISLWITNFYKELEPLVRLLIQDELKWWTTQINNLLSGLETRLIKLVQRVDAVLTEKFEAVIKTVDELRREFENLKKQMEQKIASAIIAAAASSITIYEEKEPWITTTDRQIKDELIFRYTMPGQVESTYKLTLSSRDILFSPQVRARTLLTELFDDKSMLSRRFDSIFELANTTFEELFSEKETWIPISSVIHELKTEINSAQESIRTFGQE